MEIDPLPPIRYGVWIPRLGWLKSRKGPFGDFHREVAESAAKLYGGGAFVTEIDDGFLMDVEAELLEQERLRIESGIIFRMTHWLMRHLPAKVTTHVIPE